MAWMNGSCRESLHLIEMTNNILVCEILSQVTKILGKKKNSVSYSFRSSFSLSGMGVYLFDTARTSSSLFMTQILSCNSKFLKILML